MQFSSSEAPSAVIAVSAGLRVYVFEAGYLLFDSTTQGEFL